MWHLTVRDVLAHRARFALTLLAVVLAVTFVSGSLVLTESSQRVFDEQFRTATAGVDLTVRDAAAFDSGMGVEVNRDPLPGSVVGEVAEVAGVAEAVPAAQGQGLLVVDGAPVIPTGASLVSSWAPEPFGAFAVREGRAPSGPGEVVLDVATAAQAAVRLGDIVTVRAERPTDLRVVGLAGFGEDDGVPGSTVALVSLAQAQELLDLGDAVSEVRVTIQAAAAPAEVLDALQARLGDEVTVVTAQDLAQAGAAAAKDQLGHLQALLVAMAAAALLVGAFLIANTFSIVTSQRRGEIALLRAAGATPRQVLRSVLGEAVIVGVLGAALGTAAGIAAAAGLRAVTASFGIALPEGAAVVSARTVAVSLTLGVVLTVLSALGPARRAARVAPVEAMRDAAAEPARPASRRRLVLRVVPLVIGAALLAGAVAGAPLPVLALGAVLVLTGLALAGPMVASRLARVVGAPLERAGITGHLARESAARAPRRTSSTVMSLALGLALIVFMTVVAASLKTSIANTYREVVTAEVVVESARAEMLGGLSPHVAEMVDALPEVATTSRVRFGHWQDMGSISALTAVDPETLTDVVDVEVVEGSLDALADGGVVLSEAVAAQRGLAVGDLLPMTFSRVGDEELEIVGLVDAGDVQALSTSHLISLDTYSRLFSEDLDASVFVRVAEGVSTADAVAAIEEALAHHPTADVRDQEEAVAGRTASVDQILGLVTVLLVLTVIIALLGITNTLALSVAERTREIGLLRAVGTTRRQLRWMVRSEAALVAAMAAVLGLVLGGGLAAVTTAALARTAPILTVVPVGRLAAVVVAATLAGVVAGLAPARRAARLDVLAAVAAR